MSKIPCWRNSLCSMSEAGAFYYYLPETLQSPSAIRWIAFFQRPQYCCNQTESVLLTFTQRRMSHQDLYHSGLMTQICEHLFLFELQLASYYYLDIKRLIHTWIIEIFRVKFYLSNLRNFICGLWSFHKNAFTNVGKTAFMSYERALQLLLLNKWFVK